LKIEGDSFVVDKYQAMGDSYFGEGCDLVQSESGTNFIFQLTYTSNVVMQYNTKLMNLDSFPLPRGIREGWGLTSNPEDNSKMYVTDGTSNIFVVDPWNKFNILKKIPVTYSTGSPVYSINELEWVDGYIWANIYLSNRIVRIDPNSGSVTHQFEMKPVTDDASAENEKRFGHRLYYDECINGIAYKKDTNEFYITGKNWPTVYKIEFDLTKAN
jgi:glutamine cyclotransferase